MEDRVRGITNITRISTVAVVAAVMLLLFLPALNVSAMALGIAPSTLEITDALRGGEYERTIKVFNPDREDINVALGAEGEISDWISFYQASDSSERIETLSIAADQEKVSVVVKFDIPTDTANGTYTGTIYAEIVPESTDETETGVTTTLRVPSDVTIEVTGTQNISGAITTISTEDTEVNYPVRIMIGFSNTGNVEVTPQVDVEISNESGSVSELDYAGTTVKPESQEIIQIEWDSTGQQPGDYSAHVEVTLGDVTFGERDLEFALLPTGSLTRAGALTGITLEGNLATGSLVAVVAEFANTGQIDTRAKFLGEVYCDGELVDTIESEEMLVPVGNTNTLKSYLRLENPGTYKISGYVYYEGKQTEIKEVSFTATDTGGTVINPGDDETTTTSQPFNVWIPIIGGIAALALVIIIILTVPWARLQPAREIIISKWNRLRMSGKLPKWG
jgi:hypothetical protein